MLYRAERRPGRVELARGPGTAISLRCAGHASHLGLQRDDKATRT